MWRGPHQQPSPATPRLPRVSPAELQAKAMRICPLPQSFSAWFLWRSSLMSPVHPASVPCPPNQRGSAQSTDGNCQQPAKECAPRSRCSGRQMAQRWSRLHAASPGCIQAGRLRLGFRPCLQIKQSDQDATRDVSMSSRSRTGQAVVGVSLQEGQVDRRAIGPLPVAGGVGVQADHHGLRVSSHSQVQLVVVLLVVDAVEMAARLLQQPPESATTSLKMRLSRERTLTWQKFSASSNVMSSPMTIWPGEAYCRRQAGQQAKDGKPVAVLTKPQMKPSTCHARVGSATPAVLTSWKPPVPW